MDPFRIRRATSVPLGKGTKFALHHGKMSTTKRRAIQILHISTFQFTFKCGYNYFISKYTDIKVGVNHGIFHVYRFWNFLIFKCTWVCSSSSSKNKNIYLNLSINSINLKMSIYLSISKMCSSLFSRGNQACARIANKRTTQARDAALSAIYIEENALELCTDALTFKATSSLLWKQQWNSWHLLRNNEHIFPDFMDITVWIWMKLMPKSTLYFVHNVCKWQEFLCFHTAVETIFSAVCDHFWTKTSFSTSSFWGSNSHFLDDLDYLLCNVGVSFWFYPIGI